MPKNVSVWNGIPFFHSKEGKVCQRSVWLSILSPFKKCIPTSTSMPKNFQCLEVNTLFQNKCMAISFCHLLKNVSRQLIPLQKVSLIEIEYTFFNQRKEMCVEEDYQFLSRFKKFIPTSTSMLKSFSVWKWRRFFQSKER